MPVNYDSPEYAEALRNNPGFQQLMAEALRKQQAGAAGGGVFAGKAPDEVAAGLKRAGYFESPEFAEAAGIVPEVEEEPGEDIQEEGVFAGKTRDEIAQILKDEGYFDSPEFEQSVEENPYYRWGEGPSPTGDASPFQSAARVRDTFADDQNRMYNQGEMSPDQVSRYEDRTGIGALNAGDNEEFYRQQFQTMIQDRVRNHARYGTPFGIAGNAQEDSNFQPAVTGGYTNPVTGMPVEPGALPPASGSNIQFGPGGPPGGVPTGGAQAGVVPVGPYGSGRGRGGGSNYVLA